MSALNKLTFLILLLALISCSGTKQAGKAVLQNSDQMIVENAEALKELSHFPQAKKGYERFVIIPDLKSSSETKSVKIEIIPGKTIMADCNRYALMGKLNEAVVEGWGYAYYEFISEGQMISTKMACPDYPPEERFIPGESRLLDYAKDIPDVVYVPQGFTVKYRIWKGDEKKPALSK
jgi:ecotin